MMDLAHLGPRFLFLEGVDYSIGKYMCLSETGKHGSIVAIFSTNTYCGFH